MPRIDGVSSRSTIWFKRVKPRPLTTSLCFTGVQICERKYWSLILLSDAILLLHYGTISASSRDTLLIPKSLTPDPCFLKFVDRLTAQRSHFSLVFQLG